jgi:hypothetical protein
MIEKLKNIIIERWDIALSYGVVTSLFVAIVFWTLRLCGFLLTVEFFPMMWGVFMGGVFMQLFCVRSQHGSK